MMRTTCRTCRGHKEIIRTPCTECGGKGKTVQQKRVVVPVPAGVEDGQTVRMPVGNKDIFITFRVCIELTVLRRVLPEMNKQEIFTLGVRSSLLYLILK